MDSTASRAGPTSHDPHPHRRIWAIAGPAILANISGPLVGVVDTWALGHLPDPRFLAAIAVGSFIFHFVYWSLGFLRMGTTGLAAQAFGSADSDRLRDILLRSLVLGLAFAGVIVALQGPIFAGLFALLAPSPEATELALAYCRLRIWAVPAILLRIAVIGFLVGTQRVRLALLIEVSLNLVNAALTVLFVARLGLGIEGAGLASLMAECLAGVLALVIGVRLIGLGASRAALSSAEFWRAATFARLLSVNGYIFLRTLFLQLAFALLWRVSAGLGPLTLAANQVLIQFLMLTSFGLDGFAYAAEALVGEAKGRRSRGYFVQMVRLTTRWAMAASALYCLAYFAFGHGIIAAFTNLDPVREAAGAHLVWLAAMPIISVWSYQLDGVFIGATETRAMMLTMLAALLAYGIALALLVPAYGNHGIWAAMAVFLGSRGIGLGLFYPRLARRIGKGIGSR